MRTKNISPTEVLFSKVQRCVLALFFGSPERAYYTNEVIRLANSGTGAVLRELERLSSAGLLKSTRQGNQKIYQVNKDSYLFNDLRNIVLKTFGVSDIVRDSLTSKISSIRVAFIYGSVAKHEDTTNSDIDVMIIGEDISYADLYPLLESANDKLRRQVNPTCYTPEEWVRKQKEGNNFVMQVMNQPKIFIVGSDDDLASIR